MIGPPRQGAWCLNGGPIGRYIGWTWFDAGLPHYGFHRWLGYVTYPMPPKRRIRHRKRQA